MITVNSNQRTTRQTTAQWIVVENGEERSEEIRVQYYPLTVKDLKESKDAPTDEKLWLSDALKTRLHSLPDLVDETEKPIEITVEFLDGQSITNLKNIFDAIHEHENPKSSGVSSPD